MVLELQKVRVDAADLPELVEAAQAGDRQAFGRLVDRYHRSVYAVALRRLGNHAEAQELCQDVFIQAMRKIRQVRNAKCFGAWLRAIANRLAINRLVRGRGVAPAEPEALESAGVEHRTPLVAMLDRERQAQVHAGLGRLCDLDRETLVAFYFNNHSLVEMSREFHAPVGTVKRRLHVARQRLAKHLAALAPA